MPKKISSYDAISKYAQNKNNLCLAIAVIKGDKSDYKIYGQDGVALDNTDYIYEIGSVTKTFTGLILAIGECEGLWSSSDKISDLVSDLSHSNAAKQITLLNLATHTSGLARVPKNLKLSMKNKLNPYADYAESHLIDAVSQEKMIKSGKFVYSNYGYGLLGWALSKRLGKSYSDVLREYIFNPLDMRTASVEKHSACETDTLPVYNSKGIATPLWDFQDATAGAGAVRCGITDMIKYISAYLKHYKNSIEYPIDKSIEPHHIISEKQEIKIGYAWMQYKEKDGSITCYHDGGTYGSTSYVSFNRDRNCGFIILSNYGFDLLAELPFTKRMCVGKIARILSEEIYNKQIE